MVFGGGVFSANSPFHHVKKATIWTKWLLQKVCLELTTFTPAGHFWGVTSSSLSSSIPNSVLEYSLPVLKTLNTPFLTTSGSQESCPLVMSLGALFLPLRAAAPCLDSTANPTLVAGEWRTGESPWGQKRELAQPLICHDVTGVVLMPSLSPHLQQSWGPESGWAGPALCCL